MALADFITPDVPLSRQKGWDDVTPASSQDDDAVVAIQLDADDREILQYFLAVSESGEKTRRALALTEAVIGVNSASYHGWSYRWKVLESLDSKELFLAELSFLERIAAVNVKNYQLWNHRRRVAFKLGPNSAQEELEFTEQCLVNDPKNYHSWAHRQAVIERFGLWEEELLFTAQMVQDDVRNNSAWNQRLFILSKVMLRGVEGTVRKELDFAAQAILKAPHNDSPWHYARGVANLAGGDGLLSRSRELYSICQEVLDSLPSCSPALSLLAEVHVAQMEARAAAVDVQAMLAFASLALQCYRDLQVTDPIRRNLWQFNCELIERRLAEAEAKRTQSSGAQCTAEVKI